MGYTSYQTLGKLSLHPLVCHFSKVFSRLARTTTNYSLNNTILITMATVMVSANPILANHPVCIDAVIRTLCNISSTNNPYTSDMEIILDRPRFKTLASFQVPSQTMRIIIIAPLHSNRL